MNAGLAMLGSGTGLRIFWKGTTRSGLKIKDKQPKLKSPRLAIIASRPVDYSFNFKLSGFIFFEGTAKRSGIFD